MKKLFLIGSAVIGFLAAAEIIPLWIAILYLAGGTIGIGLHEYDVKSKEDAERDFALRMTRLEKGLPEDPDDD